LKRLQKANRIYKWIIRREARVKRENLTEEQIAIFDILRKKVLSEAEKSKVKR
jgi:hypothetical protein